MTTTVERGCNEAADSSTPSIIGAPATECSTFGSAEIIRVPLPAARMTMSVSDGAPSRLWAGLRWRGAALGSDGASRRRRRFERRAKRFIVVQRLEIRLAAGERAVLRVQRDRAFQMGDRFGGLVTLR